jgi:hypothetical protein
VNRLVAILVVLVILLSGVLMFVLGRMSNDKELPFKTQDSTAKNEQVTRTKALEPQKDNSMTQSASNFTTPVRYGGDDMLDACDSNSIVVGLNSQGDNFLAVKAGPSLKAKRIDMLGPSAEVYPCDSSADGQWVGIVYDGDGKWTARCGVTSAVVPRQRYRGPCQSGWVSAKYLKLIAG